MSSTSIPRENISEGSISVYIKLLEADEPWRTLFHDHEFCAIESEPLVQQTVGYHDLAVLTQVTDSQSSCRPLSSPRVTRHRAAHPTTRTKVFKQDCEQARCVDQATDV
ncbi:hypothetical protein CC1G_14987 [Coprinopsis cinerea okayama7|uniref:Uncharacterized protein n=1 Tax=Coprinopsis cinerea (strain Okayama-7 / 130 / ATCC MYA-4618 / FGSC 9003) TaxID=240176 RepID=D6RPC6_COPC7|nr:hypothetical protein CC1G_14987 [Coprinopsis cinerea okayama7\|eukprot:XP_002910656.1 hypothetical protein CC1G_14987 [Coprinopsis cinerea okayama7\